MKTPLLTLFLSLALSCAANPIRVLYLGTGDRGARMNSHVLMRDLGRDAIWFDYRSDPKAATPEFVAKFDVIVNDAPPNTFSFLSSQPAAKVLQASALGDAGGDRYAIDARPKILAAAGVTRAARR